MNDPDTIDPTDQAEDQAAPPPRDETDAEEPETEEPEDEAGDVVDADFEVKEETEDEHRRHMRGLTEEVMECQSVVDRRTRSLKEAKADLESAQQALQRYVWKYSHPEEEAPLYTAPNGEAKQPMAEHPAQDETWRATPLSEALQGITERLLNLLQDGANVRTMGELADWTAADGGRHRLTDLEGIGPAAAEKIDEALAAFWARHGQQLREQASAAPAAAEPAAPEGEPLADLKLWPSDLDATYVASVLAQPGKKPPAVKAIEIDYRQWVNTQKATGEGWQSWTLLPLYTAAEFKGKWPEHQPDAGSFFAHTVKVGRVLYRVGPDDERRVLVHREGGPEAKE